MSAIFILCFSALTVLNVKAETTETDYAELYKYASIPDFELVHDLDPYQNEDYQQYAWSPFPLFRLAAELNFKGQKIEPGYYILTPRTMKGKDYVFFKESGKVKYIIPVVKKELVSPGFYSRNIPAPKTTKWEDFKKSTADKFHTMFKDTSKKTPPPASYIEAEYIDGDMYLIKLYFSEHKYILVFKSTRF